MIQRIQSIYLLVAAIAMTLISFKVPVYTLNESMFMAQDDTKMFILTIVGAIFSLLGLFMFKNRKFQMKLIRLTVLIQMIIGVRLFMLFNKFEVALNNTLLFLMAFSLIALIMAYRGVKKDDDLVRSVDRIR
tara:strand:+ start:119 stop:514 length:396 start_codon:yes stop_codon:yes gene_type:complete